MRNYFPISGTVFLSEVRRGKYRAAGIEVLIGRAIASASRDRKILRSVCPSVFPRDRLSSSSFSACLFPSPSLSFFSFFFLSFSRLSSLDAGRCRRGSHFQCQNTFTALATDDAVAANAGMLTPLVISFLSAICSTRERTS